MIYHARCVTLIQLNLALSSTFPQINGVALLVMESALTNNIQGKDLLTQKMYGTKTSATCFNFALIYRNAVSNLLPPAKYEVRRKVMF